MHIRVLMVGQKRPAISLRMPAAILFVVKIVQSFFLGRGSIVGLIRKLTF
jgi:uncharacterized membrane protein